MASVPNSGSLALSKVSGSGRTRDPTLGSTRANDPVRQGVLKPVGYCGSGRDSAVFGVSDAKRVGASRYPVRVLT